MLIGLIFTTPNPTFADYTFKSPEKEIARLSNNKSLTPLPNNLRYDIKVGKPLSVYPVYKYEVEYIINNKCEAMAIIPYRGSTYYSCPSGHKFWSSVLAPIPNLPLSYYTTKKHDDEQASSDAAITSSIISINSY